MSQEKTHYRKAFNSPYLSAADIVGPTELTIKCVRLEKDKTKKTQDLFNTAYFVEREIRKGEPLKPMILNATNSKQVALLTGNSFIDDWVDVLVTVYVDGNVRFGRETVEGLRITAPSHRAKQLPELTPENTTRWAQAVAAFKRDGNLDSVESRVRISDENRALIIQQASE